MKLENLVNTVRSVSRNVYFTVNDIIGMYLKLFLLCDIISAHVMSVGNFFFLTYIFFGEIYGPFEPRRLYVVIKLNQNG